jgi:hypothetical protein
LASKPKPVVAVPVAQANNTAVPNSNTCNIPENAAKKNTEFRKIKWNFTNSARDCVVTWPFIVLTDVAVIFQNLMVKEVTTGKSVVDVRLQSHVCKYPFATIPGSVYAVELSMHGRLKNGRDSYVVRGTGTYKATFSRQEMELLQERASAFAKKYMLPLTEIDRCKPAQYWSDIRQHRNCLMQTYLKDNNGQAASPINGALKGLFFTARTYPNKTLAVTSPFGKERMIVSAVKLLNPERVNYYFADFYCNQRSPHKANENGSHYVTIVICERDTQTDMWCAQRLISMDPYDNFFLRASKKYTDTFYANRTVWVEVFYTEHVPLAWGKFDEVLTVGAGTSRKNGVPHDKKCTICNIYPLGAVKNDSTEATAKAILPRAPTVKPQAQPKGQSTSNSAPSTTTTIAQAVVNNNQAVSRSMTGQRPPARVQEDDVRLSSSNHSTDHLLPSQSEQPRRQTRWKKNLLKFFCGCCLGR